MSTASGIKERKQGERDSFVKTEIRHRSEAALLEHTTQECYRTIILVRWPDIARFARIAAVVGCWVNCVFE